MRSDLERLRDIEEAIAKIEKYAVRGNVVFFDDELVQTWILFHLQTIGESARVMSDVTREQYGAVEWQKIIDFRNLVVHEYFRVDLGIVWHIVQSELSRLKEQVLLMLAEVES